jgi:glycosyltransferase involved in cell wall biosynthesis
MIVPPGPSTDRIATVPSFSVLIAVHNGAATIGAAVESALAQTRPALEVIVCDDGSTDRLTAALEPYRHRIELLTQENLGAAAALNHAIRQASGDFIAILDADDIYDPARIEALGDLAAARPDLDLLTTDARLERGGQMVNLFTDTTPFVAADQRRGIIRSCFLVAPAVRRQRALAAGGWDESLRIGYDWDCWLRLILAGARAGLVDEPLMAYRLHEGSLTADRVESFRSRVQLLEKARNHPSLTRRERRLLEAAIAWQRSRIASDAARRRGLAVRLWVRLQTLVARARFTGLGVARLPTPASRLRRSR